MTKLTKNIFGQHTENQITEIKEEHIDSAQRNQAQLLYTRLRTGQADL